MVYVLTMQKSNQLTLSGLISTDFPASFTSFASFSARVLKAPQDLQASMVTSAAELPLVGATAFVFAAVDLVIDDLVFFFGAISTELRGHMHIAYESMHTYWIVRGCVYEL